jgi:outer membrane protein assembly factor BamB
MSEGVKARLVALLVLAALATGCDWVQFRAGPGHLGATTDGAAPAYVSGLIRQWAATTGGQVASSPARAAGLVYVGSDDHKLYALNAATGVATWTATTGGAVRSSPAVDGSTVYVGSDDHKLRAFDATTGSPVWSVTVDAAFGGLGSTPTTSGGVVYVASTLGVRAFRESDGSTVWATPAPATTPSSPTVVGSLVYVASYADSRVTAYRADTGAVAWSATAPGTPVPASCVAASPAPAVDGSGVYATLCPTSGGTGASLFAFAPSTGALQWSSGTTVALSTSPAAANGTVFAGSGSANRLEAHDAASGALTWSATTGGPVESAPAVGNGIVYVGSDDGKLSAYDANGVTGCGGTPVVCTSLWSATTGGAVRSSPAVNGTSVYVGSDAGTLSAYGLPQIGFGKSALAGTSSTDPTAIRFGPDGRLYVAEFDGLIKAYTIARNGPNSYAVTATETISLVQQIPNHDDDGTLNPSVTTRLVTGLLVTGSSSSPVLYVTSSDPRVGGGVDGTSTPLDTNSGVVSRLTRVGGVWQRRDLVRGLPRSEENHATNTMVLDQATNTLYVAQAGNTNLGAPSHNFNDLPEYAYSGAILSVDLTAIGDSTYDLPTLVDENHPTLTGPFGGDFGRHQAKITAGSPVQVYSPGYRNPYAMIRSRLGKLYVVDNGSNGGWGDVPVGAGPGGTCTNAVNEPGVSQNDSLHLVTGPGYYGGHANPTRGNRANTFNTTNPQSPVPTANPIECDARGPGANGSLTSFATATTGIAEYTASDFAHQMSGDLLVSSYYGSILRVRLNATGTAVVSTQTLFSNAGTHPLDVITQDDSGAFPGTIWVPDFATGAINVFEPNDFGGIAPPPCSGAYSTSLDEDHDGYSNADEIDNHTDPCNAADAPHDWNRNFVSDLNDPNDDSAGLPDTSDPFAVDPADGLTTHIPVAYSWANGAPSNPCAPTPFPSGCPGGILGLGFTGLMTDGVTDYNKLFDTTKMTVGGAAGVLTVDQVPPGDAFGAANSQRYAFQWGVDANPADTGTFTAHTRIVGPFAGLTPTGFQSMGLYIGNGDQDNYAKLVVSANNGSPGVQFLTEVGGSDTARPVAPVTMPGPDAVDLYLTVNPAAGTVQPSYRVVTAGVAGPLHLLGGTASIPTGWLTNASRGLAIGIIATSTGGPTFPATWGVLEAVAGAPS